MLGSQQSTNRFAVLAKQPTSKKKKPKQHYLPHISPELLTSFASGTCKLNGHVLLESCRDASECGEWTYLNTLVYFMPEWTCVGCSYVIQDIPEKYPYYDLDESSSEANFIVGSGLPRNWVVPPDSDE